MPGWFFFLVASAPSNIHGEALGETSWPRLPGKLMLTGVRFGLKSFSTLKIIDVTQALVPDVFRDMDS